MNMENLIIAAVIAAVIGGIVIYLIKAHKRGEKCVGCPYAKKCGNGSCHCLPKD